MENKPKYRRILLKLSGEALSGTDGVGIDTTRAEDIAQRVGEVRSLGVDVGIVIGGGNLWRGRIGLENRGRARPAHASGPGRDALERPGAQDEQGPGRERGLPRPVLAVLLGHTKNWAFRELLATDVVDGASARPFLDAYFPGRLRAEYAGRFEAHPLRREIIATGVVNHLVNHAGVSFLHRVMASAGADLGRWVAAYLDMDREVDAVSLREAVFASGRPVADEHAALLEVENAIEQAVVASLRGAPLRRRALALGAGRGYIPSVLIPRRVGATAGNNLPHVLRDHAGRILAVLDRPSAGGTEELPQDDPALVAYLARKGPTSYFDLLRADLEFVRVIEDLIGVLLDRGVILLTDLPEQAQEKLLRRGKLRRQFRDASGLVDDEEEDVI